MLCYSNGKQVCAINIDAPKFSYSLDGIVDCIEVLSETGRGDQVVDLSMLLDDLSNGGFDGFL